MYTENELEISNKSYTNKDFATIYPELLDLVKKLTNKWDPTTSNESDPGVVLLKLAALIADKNNYNIDKNILEAFPLSVTQRANARKLYDMLGYTMNWYKAADTKVSFTYTGSAFKEKDGNGAQIISKITIPQWTMITDDTSSVIYTLKEDVQINQSMHTKEGTAIQGTIHDYDVNGVTDITLDNLDSDLRLFFTEKYVAENGIFVSNKGQGKPTGDTFWGKVDNLERENLGKKVFKFGILPNSDTCYIQFPQDIGTLIENGLNIKYIVTQGANGNIKANTLTSLYTTLTPPEFAVTENFKTKTINDDLTIQNVYSATNGCDPEDLDSAYNNYKRTVGTFNTLVTLKDYENAIYQANDSFDNNIVSNVVVSDRTCDINNTTNVIQRTTAGSERVSIVKQQTQEVTGKNAAGNDVTINILKDAMDAFNIGLYILDAVKSVDNDTLFNKSFSVSNDFEDVESFIRTQKCINHEYIQTNPVNPLIYLYKAFYRLQGKVITTYKVTQEQANDIENKIRLALFKKYNARNVNFGQPVNYDDIIKTIQNADTRIKTVVLADPEYFLRYMTSDDNEGTLKKSAGFFDKPYDSTSLPILVDFLAKMILAGNVLLYNFNRDIKFSFGQTGIKRYRNVKSITSSALISTNSTTGSDGIEYGVYKAGYTIQDNQNILLVAPNLYTKKSYTSYVNYQLISSAGEVETTDITRTNNEGIYTYKFTIKGNSYVVTFDTATPSLSATCNGSDLKVDYTKNTEIENLDCKIGGDVNISFTIEKSTYNIKYVKWMSEFTIPKNTYYQLKDSEQILINYTDSNKNVKFEWIPTNTIVKFTDTSDGVQELSKTKSTLSKTYDGVNYSMSTLTSTQQLDILAVNEVKFVDSSNNNIPQVPCMWFTKTIDRTNNAYILFNSGLDERLLEDNEYFIYTNQERNELVILGSGTLLKRSGDKKPEIKHTIAVSQSEILSDGLKALQQDDWFDFTLSRDGTLTIRELQVVTLGKNAGFRCTHIGDAEEGATEINNDLQKVSKPAYCENMNATSKSWVSLTTFDISNYDGEYLGWKVRSRLNLMMSNTYSQELKSREKLSLTLPNMKTSKRLTISWFLNGQLWSVSMGEPNTRSDNYVYEFVFEGVNCTFTISKDNYDNNTITGKLSINGTNITVEDGRFTYDDIDRFIEIKTTTEVQDGTFDVKISNTKVLTNSILGSAGGKDLDVKSSEEKEIDMYTYNERELPFYKVSDITYALMPDEETNEVYVDFDFYRSVRNQGRDFLLPFSYNGTVENVSGSVTSKNKRFIILITLNGTFTDTITVSPKSRGASPVTLTSSENVKYINVEQTSNNIFEGVEIKDWTLDITNLQKTLISRNKIHQLIGNHYYWIEVNNVEQLVIDTTLYNLNSFIKIGNSWYKFIKESGNYYLVSCNVKDLLTIGEIYVIDDDQELFSDQVTKTLEVLSSNYVVNQSTLSAKLEQEVTDPKWKFDITYIVPEEDKIDTSTTDESNTDYLFSSTAVFDSHHIMNKYLIPQLITGSETSIKVAPQSINK